MVHSARRGCRGRSTHAGSGGLARCRPTAGRPFVQPYARWARADHAGALAGLPAGRGPPRTCPGACHGGACPGTPGRGGGPSDGRRNLRRDGVTRPPAPPPRGDRVAEAVTGPATRRPRGGGRGSPVHHVTHSGQSDEDIARSSDLRAVALMNLGTV